MVQCDTAALLLSHDIHFQETEEAAGLKSGPVLIPVYVLHTQDKEEEFAFCVEGGDRCIVQGFTVQKDGYLHLDLRVLGINLIIGPHIEQIRDAQAEYHIIAPEHLNGEPAVHLKAEPRHIDIQGDVDPGPEYRTAQRHIKLDGISIPVYLETACGDRTLVRYIVPVLVIDESVLRHPVSLFPFLQEEAEFIIPAHEYIILLDLAVFVGIQDDIQLGGTEHIPHCIADKLYGSARAVEFFPEIGQESHPKVPNEGGSLGHLVANQGNILGKTGAHDILDRAQDQIDPIQYIRGVVQDAHQGEIRDGNLRQFHDDSHGCIGPGTCQFLQCLQQGLVTPSRG